MCWMLLLLVTLTFLGGFALVAPSRKYLWILSRTPQMDEVLYDEIVSRLPERGYDPAGLNRTPQPASGVD